MATQPANRPIVLLRARDEVTPNDGEEVCARLGAQRTDRLSACDTNTHGAHRGGL